MLRTDKTALALVLSVLLIPLTVCLPLMFAAAADSLAGWPICFGSFGLAIILGAYLIRAITNRIEERVSDKQKRKRG
jgi:membrane protein implicated in regulation of membrane protease activity